MNRHEINQEVVITALKPIAKHNYETLFAQRTKDTSLLNQAMYGRIPEDKGDGFASFRQSHAVTTKRLEGSLHIFNSQSLIRQQNFIIPENVTKENVESLIYARDIARLSFGMIRITEPGIFKPVKTQMNRVYMTNTASLEASIVAGLTHVLNGTTVDKDAHSEFVRGLDETWRLAKEIRHEESEYVDAIIGIALSGQVESDEL